MKNLFKELIATFHASDIPVPSKRQNAIPHPPKDLRKACVLIGMRRSGKTWSLYQVMHDLMAKGLEKSKLVYINFEDERLSDMQKENFQDILHAYFELYPDYLNCKDVYFFFDEIHEVEGWEKFIRRLLDQEKMQLYITGSSSKMLSKEIASSLRGRTLSQEIFPFNFAEYLDMLKKPRPKLIGTKERIQLTSLFGSFLLEGGFPETIGQDPEMHRALLQGYTASVIYRDIVERYQVSNTHALKQLLAHCLRNSATIFSVSKMFNVFKSMGYTIGKNSLYEFMDYFEDSYCVFSLNKFDLSLRKAAQSMKKIFTVDQGLITAFTMSSAFDQTQLLETAVFSHLRRKSSELFYYHTKEGKEVDFVQLLPDQSLHLFQVCLSLKDTETRKREVDALNIAMRELSVPTGTIITFDEEEEIKVPSGVIACIPAWKVMM
ncbi:MAG: ATP-binding protein [Chlamydiales bacterium]|nr:ATP-binding protein [Chlamydiales bacterium]